DRVDGLVDARELQGAAEADACTHRRHRHPRLAEERAEPWLHGRGLERQAVALPRLQRQRGTEIARERLRPDAGAEYELVGFDSANARLHGADARLVDGPATHFGVVKELGACPLKLASQ